VKILSRRLHRYHPIDYSNNPGSQMVPTTYDLCSSVPELSLPRNQPPVTCNPGGAGLKDCL